MANVVQENINVQHDKISVTVSKTDYFENFEKSLKKYSKDASIPGFRKGMVPTSLIKKMHGAGVYQEEVLKVVDKTIQDYFEAEKIEFFAQPLPMDEEMLKFDFNNPTDYTLNFEIGVKPIFEPADLSKGTFTNYVIEVTDEMIEKEVENLLKRHKTFEAANEVVHEDDKLKLVIIENWDDDGLDFKEIDMPASYFKESFRQNIIGKKVDDKFAFTLTEAFETTEQNFIKKELDIDKADETANNVNRIAKLKAITTPVIPTLNEDFFKVVFPNKNLVTEDDFRAEIKKDVERYLGEVSKGNICDQIFKYLIDNTVLPLPKTFFKLWMVKGQENPLTPEKAEADYPEFEKSVRWTVISNEIAKQNHITVTTDDIKNHAIAQLANYYGGAMGMDTEAAWVQQFAEGLLKDKKFVNEAIDKITQNKVFDWAEGVVTITNDAVSLDAFNEIRSKQ